MAQISSRLRLALLASHGGTNLQAVLDACQGGRLAAVPCLVISNNSGAMALERARCAGVPWRHLSSHTHPDPAALDEAICQALVSCRADLVVLVGYMKKLGPRTLGRYRGRILNIHPALLPKYGGRGMYGDRVHRAVLAAGEAVTGVTIHLVDERYDHGPIVSQAQVPVLPEDTVATLRERVLAQEHELLVQTLQIIATNYAHRGGRALAELGHGRAACADYGISGCSSEGGDVR